ncbi:MAG: nucleotide exchange factor GrpE [Actinobacteria bacterium 13_2_20CM_2_71_6]|nr:MAG: nucleotide exchange factor GrpE [Actinobacteria bacterium 13_2_20CM_2_71_6]
MAEQNPTGSAESAEEPPSESIAELRARVADLEDKWRRALADLDNLRKRVARESAARSDAERARVAAQWLPVVDNLDLALEHGGSDPSPIVEGVRAVRDQAVDILARLGFPRRTDVGERFDPASHEAVAALAVPDAPAGTVVQVVRPGYGTGEHLLRPAAVVVAKGD